MESLRLRTSNFISSSLANRSIGSYKTALNRFLHFCNNFDITPALNEDNYMLFASYLSDQVTGETIASYLSGLQYFAKLSGATKSLKEMHLLHYTMRSIKKAKIVPPRPKRKPITTKNLHNILRFLILSNMSSWEKKLYWSACLLAFFGLMRSSEYCCKSRKTFVIDSTLCMTDISFTARGMVIRIRQSKTDVFGLGARVNIGFGQEPICPVKAMHEFIRARGQASGPVYIFQDQSYLTRIQVRQLIVQAIPEVQNLNTHSFRIGGATALAQAGIPEYTIQLVGRWASDCFKIYLRFPEEYTYNLSSRMSNDKDVSE